MNFVSPKTKIELIRKIKAKYYSNNFGKDEAELFLKDCFRQFKNDKNFSFPPNCYDGIGRLDIGEVLKLIYDDNDALYLIADSL